MARVKKPPALATLTAHENVGSGKNDRLINSETGGQVQPKKSGGRAPKDKGSRFERAIVKLLQNAGLGAERVLLSGSAGGSFCGDLTVPILGRDLIVEAKARFRELYSWLEGRDALIDRRDAQVVIPLRLAAEIAAAAERRKA